jgi:hypothetical protein
MGLTWLGLSYVPSFGNPGLTLGICQCWVDIWKICSVNLFFKSNFQSPKRNYLFLKKKTPIDLGNLFLLFRYLIFPIRKIITLWSNTQLNEWICVYIYIYNLFIYLLGGGKKKVHESLFVMQKEQNK